MKTFHRAGRVLPMAGAEGRDRRVGDRQCFLLNCSYPSLEIDAHDFRSRLRSSRMHVRRSQKTATNTRRSSRVFSSVERETFGKLSPSEREEFRIQQKATRATSICLIFSRCVFRWCKISAFNAPPGKAVFSIPCLAEADAQLY